MEIEEFIKKMKDIYSHLINFIEATDDSDVEFKALIDFLNEKAILENQEEIRLLFQLISKIADNHHRTSDIFNKFEKIFQFLSKDFPSPISYIISDYTYYNKRILFLLLENKFIKPDETFLHQYLQNRPDNKSFLDQKMKDFYYLYPKIKEFLEEELQKQIEKEILENYKEKISTFEEKCQIGENDSYICSLIRSDSIEEFVAYINRTNLSLSTKITPSIYETNSFLIDKKPTLIEYASFFGSIQIIQYLKYNNVPLTSSLWLYTIHSNNAELVHFLEENKVESEIDFRRHKIKTFKYVLKESIKCHHNAITNYIKDNLYEQILTDNQYCFYDNFNDTIINSLNFFFYPDDIKSMICESIKEKGFTLSQLCFFLTFITIPSSVTSIGKGSFSCCSSLEQITTPSSVTSIGDYAFSYCRSLKRIAISSSVTSIGNYVFYFCLSLTQITIPSSVTSIGNYAFSCCPSLEQITIPSSVTSIGNNSFEGCSSLTQITIPSSVTSIGNNSFEGCSSLTQISIPSSVTSIGDYIFNRCSSLRQISIPSSLASIVEGFFYFCSSLTQIAIPSSVTSIEISAFYFCSSLTQITIPSSVTSIGDYAFWGCSSLTQITIPSSVTSIGDFAFCECSLLKQISIPSSVTSIGECAFKGCPLPIWTGVFNRCSLF